MSEAPPIGDVVIHNGKEYRRIVSGVQVDAGLPYKKYPYESYSLPDMEGFCQWTQNGTQIVKSKAHENEICARTNRKRW